MFFFLGYYTQDFSKNLGYFSQEFEENSEILGILEQNHSNLQEFNEILGYFQTQIKNTDVQPPAIIVFEVLNFNIARMCQLSRRSLAPAVSSRACVEWVPLAPGIGRSIGVLCSDGNVLQQDRHGCSVSDCMGVFPLRLNQTQQ